MSGLVGAGLAPRNLSRQAAYLLALAHAAKAAEAAQGAAALRSRVGHGPDLLLQLARCYAACAAQDREKKAAYTERALEALREEYRDARLLQTDPDLEALQPEPGFQAILAAVKDR